MLGGKVVVKQQGWASSTRDWMAMEGKKSSLLLTNQRSLTPHTLLFANGMHPQRCILVCWPQNFRSCCCVVQSARRSCPSCDVRPSLCDVGSVCDIITQLSSLCARCIVASSTCDSSHPSFIQTVVHAMHLSLTPILLISCFAAFTLSKKTHRPRPLDKHAKQLITVAQCSLNVAIIISAWPQQRIKPHMPAEPLQRAPEHTTHMHTLSCSHTLTHTLARTSQASISVEPSFRMFHSSPISSHLIRPSSLAMSILSPLCSLSHVHMNEPISLCCARGQPMCCCFQQHSSTTLPIALIHRVLHHIHVLCQHAFYSITLLRHCTCTE